MLLGNPLPGDPKVVSGESGAVTTGFLSYILDRGPYHEIAERLGIDRCAKILLISTEGDTDTLMYRRIMEGSLAKDNGRGPYQG